MVQLQNDLMSPRCVECAGAHTMKAIMNSYCEFRIWMGMSTAARILFISPALSLCLSVACATASAWSMPLAKMWIDPSSLWILCLKINGWQSKSIKWIFTSIYSVEITDSTDFQSTRWIATNCIRIGWARGEQKKKNADENQREKSMTVQNGNRRKNRLLKHEHNCTEKSIRCHLIQHRHDEMAH